MNTATRQPMLFLPGTAPIGATVEQFDPISLREMDAVALLNRVDVKYILTPEQLLAALAPLRTAYRVLEVNQVRLNHYQTLYFDTPDFALYRVHHNGSQNRYKVRFRTYVDSGVTFFEIKAKNNKGRTVKSRLRVAGQQQQLDDTFDDFLHAALNGATPPLEAKLWNSFTRITLVSTTQIERLTIDFDLCFTGGDSITRLPNLVVAEIKQEGYARRSEFVHRLHTVHAEQMSFSKYCIGAALHYPHLKQNNFKSIFLRLRRMGVTPVSIPARSPLRLQSSVTNDNFA